MRPIGPMHHEVQGPHEQLVPSLLRHAEVDHNYAVIFQLLCEKA